MAHYDTWQWNSDNARLMPEGTGTVCLRRSESDSDSEESSDPDIYTITIHWNDDRDSGTPDDSFVVEFQP